MSKYRTTKKAIREAFKNIIVCDIQYMITYKSAFAYSTRAEGWACDYYMIDDNTVICTGYAPITGRVYKPGYVFTRPFEEKARVITSNYAVDWEERARLIDELLHEYIKQVLTMTKGN